MDSVGKCPPIALGEIDRNSQTGFTLILCFKIQCFRFLAWLRIDPQSSKVTRSWWELKTAKDNLRRRSIRDLFMPWDWVMFVLGFPQGLYQTSLHVFCLWSGPPLSYQSNLGFQTKLRFCHVDLQNHSKRSDLGKSLNLWILLRSCKDPR